MQVGGGGQGVWSRSFVSGGSADAGAVTSAAATPMYSTGYSEASFEGSADDDKDGPLGYSQYQHQQLPRVDLYTGEAIG
jgi:hypothetical protein